MARALSSEELQFRKRARRRLIGAITLVLIAVVALPMVLEREPRPVSQSIEIRIPSRETAPPLEASAPSTEASTASRPSATTPSTGPAEAATPSAPKEKANEAQAGAAQASLPESRPEAESAAPQPKGETQAAADNRKGEAAGAYVVQVGAFSSAENAKHLKDRLSANGIQAYTETVATSKGKQVRVRAGPFPTREAAEQTLAKLERLGLKGIIAPL